jgi:predicted nucleotidyltransferase
MESVSKVDPVLRETCRRVATEEPRLVALYLFGSRADGTARPDSDVDLGALFSGDMSLDDLLDLEGRLEDAIGLPTQLIDAGHASPFLALDIIKGERIFCRDRHAADEFDLYVMRRAGDLAFFERERRRMVLTPGAHGEA